MSRPSTLRAVTHPPDPARRAGWAYVAVTALTLIIVAVLWRSVMRRKLDAAVVATAAEQLGHARGVFDGLRERTMVSLLAECGVLVEDPRLKASLATDGVDEATVRDILADILRLRRTGFLLVLSRDGHVFAEAGADELRGLDLSSSSVMTRARAASETIGGAWVIGGKLVDLAVASVRFDKSVLAYLVVGQAVDPPLVKSVEASTGTAIAVIAGAAPGPVSSSDPALIAVFQRIAAEPGARPPHLVEHEGEDYVAASFDLEGTAMTHPRIAMARPLLPQRAPFAGFAWLLWLPCGMVVLGVMAGAMRGRGQP